ncbi:MAG: fumarylacetoacetate hydrolase family protein [Bdellovibrionales bacterium]|jgi:fumarylpyruvate hydrolase|nr:fumarylacetoacetate hydrolase family protein [Bdellovibrionales bacterium]
MTATYVFPPAPLPFLPVAGRRDVFPVRRIFCVGQNYALHAAEMGAKAGTAEGIPVFFMKPADSIAHDGDIIPYPPETASLHHEVELVVALGMGGANIPETSAAAHIFGYTVGLDLTRRDLQKQAKENGKPWDLGKGFDNASPCGILIPAGSLPGLPQGAIQLAVNGDLRQDGQLSDMIWPIPRLIALLSRFITLHPGDILMTGTPAGVGPLLPGDKVDAHIDHIGDLSVTIR